MLDGRAERLLSNLYKKGKLTVQDMEEHDLYDSEMRNITNDRHWESIYMYVTDVDVLHRCNKCVEKVLGRDWKERYDYKESRESSENGCEHSLMIRLTEEEQKKIYEKGE